MDHKEFTSLKEPDKSWNKDKSPFLIITSILFFILIIISINHDSEFTHEYHLSYLGRISNNSISFILFNIAIIIWIFQIIYICLFYMRGSPFISFLSLIPITTLLIMLLFPIDSKFKYHNQLACIGIGFCVFDLILIFILNFKNNRRNKLQDLTPITLILGILYLILELPIIEIVLIFIIIISIPILILRPKDKNY